MNVHHYDSTTGEYIHSTAASLDPLATEQAGEPVYLLPARATWLAPPAAGEGEVAVWRDAAWTLVPDHRGQVYWLPDGTQYTITALGETPPEDALFAAPPLSLEDQILAALREVREIAQAAADALIGSYPDYERETWADQVREAEAVLSDDAGETPILGAIAAARGIPVADIAPRVIANRDAWRAAGAAIVAARQAAEDQLAAVTDAAEIATIIQSVRDVADHLTAP